MEHPPSTEKTGPQKGDVIEGKLEIDGIIAEGRTSTVASAVDRETGKRVAVKIARGSDLEAMERFRRAARGMQKLTSRHAVKVLRVGTTTEGAPCMSMEHLEGRTLAQKITQSGPLPVDETVKWVLQVCDALADAHANGLLHRDLDAENIFLAMPPSSASGEPSVRVLDFGLAPVWRLGKGDGRLRPGDVPGTSFALAPELARGSDLDERVDVWGVGACLFRLLTNKHVFVARNLAELCTRILAERAPDVGKLRPDVTPGLAALVKKCLEREPDDRYATIREVIAALHATQDEAPLTPQVKTEKATLDQLRAYADHADDRITDPGPSAPSSDFDEAATAIHKKSDLLATVASPHEAKTVLREGKPKPDAPTDPSHDHETPRTVRAAPAFEAIAARLEPPKKKSGGPPPIPPELVAPEPVIEDGPSTQPLGRLSPFAELPKAGPPSADPPSSELDRTIKPVLIGEGPSAQPLPKPSPAMMAMETIPPPKAEPVGLRTFPLKSPDPAAVPAPLPRPSPAAMAAETIPRGMEPPVPPPGAAPLVFHAPPRVLDMPGAQPSGPPPPLASHAPGALPSGPPALLSSGPPTAMDSSRAMASGAVAVAPPSEVRPKSKLIVPLIFALGIAVSIVVGLYVARLTTVPKPTLASTEGSAAPTPTPSPAPSTTPATDTTAATEPATATPAAATPAATASDEPEPAPTTSHRRHKRPAPSPSPTPSASAEPAPKGGSLYDPSGYDPK